MTRAQRGSKTYENIVDNQIVIEEDNVFQERSKKFGFEFLLKDLFVGMDYKLEQNKLDRENVISIERKDGSKIFFSYFKVTNAGQPTNRKRMQIPENYYGLDINGTKRKAEDTYFFIGLYPTGENDNPVYVLLDNDGFSLNPQQSYSSLWINFDSLFIANTNGIHYAINRRNGNKYVCFQKKYWGLLMNAIVENDFTSIIDNQMSYIDKTGNIESEDDSKYVEMYDESKDAFVYNKKAKLRKNSNYRDLILYESGYVCSLCNKNVTFKTNANKMYFEAHHLIPCNFNMQQQFDRKLDNPANMYCLCPECHRKIHFINDLEVDGLLNLLYNKRSKSYMDNYNLTLADLLSIYKKIDRKAEEEM